jgi:hypothetical protein
MADQQGTKQIIALAMVISAITLAVLAVLIYAGTIPFADDMRLVASLVIGAAAFLDLLIGMWFFRQGQSS